MKRKVGKSAIPHSEIHALNRTAREQLENLASREAIARLACSDRGVALLREALAALPAETANKLNELIGALETAASALSDGAAWEATSGLMLLKADVQPMFGTFRVRGEKGWRKVVYWWECGEVLSRFVVRDDGLSALALLHAKLPKAVTPDVMQHPHGGILPTPLAGAAVRVQVSDRFDERLPELPGPGVAADGVGWLPGFDPGPGPLAKLPALDFLHAGGLEAFQRGRGAPWPLRIAYETLIDVPAAARNGGIARLEYPLRGDGDATLQAMLYPEGRLNLSRDWGRFIKALEVVDRFSVPADGGMSAWLPIRVRSVPVRTGGRVAPRRIPTARFGQGTAHLAARAATARRAFLSAVAGVAGAGLPVGPFGRQRSLGAGNPAAPGEKFRGTAGRRDGGRDSRQARRAGYEVERPAGGVARCRGPSRFRSLARRRGNATRTRAACIPG